jgi:hypothetical protein
MSMDTTIRYAINAALVGGLIVLCYFGKLHWPELLGGIGLLLVPSAVKS